MGKKQVVVGNFKKWLPHEIYSGRFSEESSRTIHELGNIELHELGQVSRTVSMPILLDAHTGGIVLLLLRVQRIKARI